MKRTKGKGILPIFKILLLLVLLLFLARAGEKVYTLYTVQRETAKTEAKVKELKEQNEALEQEKKNLGDIKYIEKLAREEHNMVGKNEIPIFVVDDKKTDAKSKEEKNK